MLQRSSSKHNMQPPSDTCGGTAYFTNKQMSDYLKNLRSKRTQRPSGARPMLSTQGKVRSDREGNRLSSSEFVLSNASQPPPTQSRSASAFSSRPDDELISTGRMSSDRMYYPEYVEREQRQQEKIQARAMRLAMQELDIEEEQRITSAARRESTDLIRRHRFPDAPYKVADGECKSSHSPVSEDKNVRLSIAVPDDTTQARAPVAENQSHRVTSNLFSLNRRSSKKRIASGNGRPLSFPNDREKIYEDPVPAAAKPRTSLISPSAGIATRRNPFARARNSVQNTASNNITAPIDTKPAYKVPSKESNSQPFTEPGYTSAEILKSTVISVETDINTQVEPVRYRDGKEIRSEEIRAATSRTLRERSPKLPSPTAVSDSPGRPIVSFEKDWSPAKEETQQAGPPPTMGQTPMSEPRSVKGPRSHVEKAKVAPVIESRQVPSICVEQDEPNRRASHECSRPQPAPLIHAPAVPTININVAEPPPAPEIDEKQAQEAISKPRQKVQHTRQPRSNGEARLSTLCAQCALPIRGRTVSAAGIRFHPECFRCYYCGEGLECVGFYPEPARHREERQDRIDRRMAGEEVFPPEGISLDEDEDDSLRFYCHLDFHELFSPRCKSCKTPIEGEVIVACGAEWHVGHFFCAQCGDPFDPTTPFVEKDGYAWCVNCHLNRFSGKCTGCRKPITEKVVQALGVDWHPACFRCSECDISIEGGQYFLRGDKKEVVCQRCEERRLKG